MRIDEINTRLAAIQNELETATGDQLAALEAEVEALTAERQQIQSEAQTRQQLRANIAAGIVTGTTIERHEEENTMENTRTYAIDSAEYREAYLLRLQGRELNAEQRAAVSASAAIPTQTMNAIVHRLELAPIINAVDVTYIPGNVSYPVEGTNADAAWVAMGTAATDSEDAVTAVALGAYKLIKTVEITADVAAMAVDAFESWLVNRLANKLQRAVAAGIMTGTGVTQATGLSSLAAKGSYTKVITYTDVMTIIAALPAEYMPGASFVMSRASFFGNVLNIQDTAKHPIVVADAQAPAKFNILGFPVILEDAAGTDIYFGDLKEAYKFNFAKAPEITSDGSVAFRTGSTVYRAMALADGKPTGKGIVRYTAGS